MLEDPEEARALGVDPPTGVLLTGPPGTGKTTIARVLAAQAHCSFYLVSAADLLGCHRVYEAMYENPEALERLLDKI